MAGPVVTTVSTCSGVEQGIAAHQQQVGVETPCPRGDSGGPVPVRPVEHRVDGVEQHRVTHPGACRGVERTERHGIDDHEIRLLPGYLVVHVAIDLRRGRHRDEHPQHGRGAQLYVGVHSGEL
ncbi:hypothetical protein OED52_06235 [Rhodococcus sp. Z13]|uniref:Uncharacterized protein n=1 Tax=Rhodococcus sacchari TaxID=2962047 RepID=A0ACD4DJC1_9NOCA|nr:hypothetical protein [Rhodococcus sp. Z13]UYP20138.1 hypothetical protein OED52_06235 [Rhodococcus sp. Z13]